MKKIFPQVLFFTLLVVMVSVVSCVQIIYEDPNYVDFSSDESTQVVEEDIVISDDDFSEMQFVEQGDIRIYYDESVAVYVDDAGEVIPPASGDELYAPAHPGYSDFNFSIMKTHIYVADLAAYEQAADFSSGLIADLYSVIDGSDTADPCVPELPLGTFYHECGHQEFVSNFKRIPLGNGSGVRYITVYAIQDLTPVGNAALKYVFQGFTDDGKYYVKAIVEMIHSQLEGIGEIPADIYAASDAETLDAYFAQYSEIFEDLDKDFKPKLDWIDSILASLFIQ